VAKKLLEGLKSERRTLEGLVGSRRLGRRDTGVTYGGTVRRGAALLRSYTVWVGARLAPIRLEMKRGALGSASIRNFELVRAKTGPTTPSFVRRAALPGAWWSGPAEWLDAIRQTSPA
jgi:hypothetical protein